MIKPEILIQLAQISFISEKDFSLEERTKFQQDRYKLKTHLPDVIARPKNSQEVKQIIDFANSYKIPITCRGAGTATTGSATPVKGGILLSFAKMNHIIEIDQENKVIVCEPGVLTAEIHRSAEAINLFYPPDPASAEECMIGGNIMTNAGGMRALKYGVTRDYVLGLEGFWANGQPFKLGGKILKEQAGYALKQLLIGSEGTLGIVTKITLKLISKPKFKEEILIIYNNYNDAVKTLSQIHDAGIKPSIAEFFNNFTIVAAEKYLTKPLFFNKAKVAFILQLDGNDEKKNKAQLNMAKAIAKKNSAQKMHILKNDLEKKLVWGARKCMSDALSKISKNKISIDPVLPLNKIAQYMQFLQEVDNETELKVVSFGHLGDGNVHINILNISSSPKTWESERKKIIKILLEKAIFLGGTISGEHGIGLAKKTYLELIHSKENILILKKIKKCFDPQNILNPGKII